MIRWKHKREWLPFYTTGAVVLALGAAVGAAGPSLTVPISVSWKSSGSDADGFVPAARRDAGDEVVLVVIGSSACYWSSSSQFGRLFQEARDSITIAAQRQGVGFATMGVSQDAVLEEGVGYLSRLGRFDEVAVGRSWRNAAIMKYIYGQFPGEAATPQILVLSRKVVGGSGNWGIADEELLVRKTGLFQIEQWVQGGSRIPRTANTATEGGGK